MLAATFLRFTRACLWVCCLGFFLAACQSPRPPDPADPTEPSASATDPTDPADTTEPTDPPTDPADPTGPILVDPLRLLEVYTYTLSDQDIAYGVVRNDSKVNLSKVRLYITFYDTAGEELYSAEAEVMRTLVRPKQETPFVVRSPKPGTFADQVTHGMSATWEITSQDTNRDVKVSSYRLAASGAGTRLSGSVVNNSSRSVQQVRVIYKCFRDSTNLVGVGYAPIAQEPLAAGQSSTYEARLELPDVRKCEMFTEAFSVP